jgi:hypothetical protein
MEERRSMRWLIYVPITHMEADVNRLGVYLRAAIKMSGGENDE